MKITIIICTYNRASILNEVLQRLITQIAHPDVIELLVIDNNSEDNTDAIITKFAIPEPKVIPVSERTQGLSFARNKGAQVAKGDWLLYLDDDGKLIDGSIDHAIDSIKSNRFDLISGIWQAWYKKPPPKWLPHSTGNYILKGSHELRDIGDDYVSGGVMLINRQKLLKIGGFPTHLGMTGDKVAYGEESYVENEFKKRDWKVGINPNIVIDHLVGEHKYQLSWHLEAAYAKGRDGQYINRKSSKFAIYQSMAVSLFSGWIKPLVKLIFKKKYYRQNFVIDYWGSIKYDQGRLSTLNIK